VWTCLFSPPTVEWWSNSEWCNVAVRDFFSKILLLSMRVLTKVTIHKMGLYKYFCLNLSQSFSLSLLFLNSTSKLYDYLVFFSNLYFPVKPLNAAKLTDSWLVTRTDRCSLLVLNTAVGKLEGPKPLKSRGRGNNSIFLSDSHFCFYFLPEKCAQGKIVNM